MKKVFLSVINDLTTDQRVHRIATTLAKNGYEVTLIGRRFSNSFPVERRIYKTKRLRFLFKKGAFFYFCFNVRLFAFLMFKRSDILVANDLDTLLANFLVSRLKRKPLIYDSHEYFTEVPELVNRVFPRKVWKGIEKLLLPRIRFASTVCDSIANEYKNIYGIDMTVIYNYPIRKQLDFTKDEQDAANRVIIYQGSLNIGRGLEYVIDAMQYVDNAVFRIYGDGDITEVLKERVKLRDVETKVVFKGKLPFHKLHEETIQADLGIALEENIGLNYYYALPNKIFDYIQAHVPVIVSPFPEMIKIVHKYDIGLIYDHRSSEKLGEIINQAFDLKNRYNKWKDNLEIAAKNLSWEKEEPKLLDLYRHAASKCN